MDSITYNYETVIARRNSMLIVGVYLLRIQILVVGGYPAPTQWVRRLGGPGAARSGSPHAPLGYLSHGEAGMP
jgi:hypothetical protein